MAVEKFVIGVDFGTESGRALLVNVKDGQEIASAVHRYSNGVIDETLPDSDIKLEPDWALQDPGDYLETLRTVIPAVLKASGTAPETVIGLGIDFTACTMMPTKKDGTPLCFLSEWRHHPHAWVKLWKHHAAQPEANRLNQIAREQGQSFLNRYGGKISSEWFFPKVWQILDEAPEIYAAADRLLEAGDWVVWMLTGVETRNSCAAGYKALWSKREGYPSDQFLAVLDSRLEHAIDEKMSRTILSQGRKAGGLTQQAAAWIGLRPGTAVAVANVDAHVSVPAAGIVYPGSMVIIMGTSNCHLVMGTDEVPVPGICGFCEDGIVPGYFGYEGGQSCVGDHFAWFMENCVPAAYQEEAMSRDIDIHTLLEERAGKIRPGESGLIALDWWNGNRSVLVDAELTGLLIGQTLATKPEDIYRALIESTAFGTRMIIETFIENGVIVNEIVATGGLPDRNKLLMQIYADVSGKEVKIAQSRQASALGSAMFGAVAAGAAQGGYDTIIEAAQAMAHQREEKYIPNPENARIYNRLFAEYQMLHDHFGRGENDVMKRLKAIKSEVLGLR